MIDNKELEKYANQGITIVVNGIELTFSMLYDSIGAHPMWCADNGLRAYCSTEMDGKPGLYIDIDDAEGQHLASMESADTFETFAKYCTKCTEALQSARTLSCPACYTDLDTLHEVADTKIFNILDLDLTNEFRTVTTFVEDARIVGYKCPMCSSIAPSAYEFCRKVIQ